MAESSNAVYLVSPSTFFFFNDTATTEIYTLSLHDALPISPAALRPIAARPDPPAARTPSCTRSEEHTSELQSRRDLVCRLLLEKKNNSHNTCFNICLAYTKAATYLQWRTPGVFSLSGLPPC